MKNGCQQTDKNLDHNDNITRHTSSSHKPATISSHDIPKEFSSGISRFSVSYKPDHNTGLPEVENDVTQPVTNNCIHKKNNILANAINYVPLEF